MLCHRLNTLAFERAKNPRRYSGAHFLRALCPRASKKGCNHACSSCSQSVLTSVIIRRQRVAPKVLWQACLKIWRSRASKNIADKDEVKLERVKLGRWAVNVSFHHLERF